MGLGLGLRAIKRYPELVPLLSFIGAAVAGGTGYMFYSLYQKPDVIVNKSNPVQPYDRVDIETPQKLVTLKMKYEKIPELEKLRKEIGSYKAH